MTSFDYTVLTIIGFSVIFGVMRGLIKEIVSLISWVLAFFVAKMYSPQFEPYLPADIPSDALKYLAAFIILFLLTLLMLKLVTLTLQQVFKTAGLGWFDRLLGMLFGLLRGVAICMLLVFAASYTSLPKNPLWVNAMFSAPLEALVHQALPWLPQKLAQASSLNVKK